MSPKTTNPKNIQLNVLIDEATSHALEVLSKELEVSKSEIIRQAVSEYIAKQVKVMLRKIELEIEALSKAKQRLEEMLDQDPEQEVTAYDVEGLCEIWCRDCPRLSEGYSCAKYIDEYACKQWGCIRTAEQWYQWVNSKLSELGKKLASLRAL